MKKTELFMLLNVLFSVALICDYEPQPEIAFDMSLPLVADKYQFFESKIWWRCVSNMSEYSCMSTIHETNDSLSGVIQTNPDPRIVKGVGVVDHIISDGRVINMYFQAEGNILHTDQSYLFEVHCSDGTSQETFSAIVNPTYRGFDAPFGVFGTFMSTGGIAGLIITGMLILVVLGVIVWGYKKMKQLAQ